MGIVRLVNDPVDFHDVGMIETQHRLNLWFLHSDRYDCPRFLELFEGVVLSVLAVKALIDLAILPTANMLQAEILFYLDELTALCRTSCPSRTESCCCHPAARRDGLQLTRLVSVCARALDGCTAFPDYYGNSLPHTSFLYYVFDFFNLFLLYYGPPVLRG